MKISDFKKIGRLLKTAYAELEAEAIKGGLSLMSPQYEQMQSKVRELVLKKHGFTVQEYRDAKDKVLLVPKEDQQLLSIMEDFEGGIKERMDKFDAKHIPTKEEIIELAREIFRQTPPQIINQIVREVKEPTIVKETVIQKQEYDDSLLRKDIEELKSKKMVTQEELKANAEKLKTDILTFNSKNFSENFKANINMMGMPDFRKLAMGLQEQIDGIAGIESLTDLGVTASAAELNVLDGIPATLTATELGYVDGVTSAIQTQLDAKAPLASPTFTGTVVLPTVTAGGVITLSENSSIALDPAGSADGKYSGITVAGTAGATLAFGDLIYLAAADSRWELADADSATTADRMLGMCVLAAGSDGSATTVLLQGIIRADAAFPDLTVGSPVYVGETAGDVQVAIPTGADNVIRRVGFALTANELYFNPSQDVQTTVA